MMSELIHDDHSHDHDHSHGGKMEVILFFAGFTAFLIALFVNAGTWKPVLYIVSLILSGYHIIIEGFIDTFQQSVKRKSLCQTFIF